MSGVRMTGVPGFVYAVLAMSGRSAGETKIGFTTREPILRVREIAKYVDTPDIEVLWVGRGVISDERHLHYRFARFAVGAEWFRLPNAQMRALRSRRKAVLRGRMMVDLNRDMVAKAKVRHAG